MMPSRGILCPKMRVIFAKANPILQLLLMSTNYG